MSDTFELIDWQFNFNDRGTYAGAYFDKLNQLVAGYNTAISAYNAQIASGETASQQVALAEAQVALAQAKVVLAAQQVALAQSAKNDAEAAAIAANDTVAGSHTHTAAQVGALPNTGGVVTGTTTFKGSFLARNADDTFPVFRIDQSLNLVHFYAYQANDASVTKGFLFTGIVGNKDVPHLRVQHSGAQRNIFHEGFLPTAAQVGADDTVHYFSNSATTVSVDLSLAKHHVINLYDNYARTVAFSGSIAKGGSITISTTKTNNQTMTLTGKTFVTDDGFPTELTFSKAKTVKLRAYGTNSALLLVEGIA